MKKSAEEVLTNIQNIAVDEYATPCSITGAPDENLQSIFDKMQDGGVRHVPIFDGPKLVGILTDRDLRNFQFALDSVLVEKVMAQDVYQVVSGSLLRDVVFEMSEKKLGSVIVYDSANEEYSIFTSIDALNALNEILR